MVPTGIVRAKTLQTAVLTFKKSKEADTGRACGV